MRLRRCPVGELSGGIPGWGFIHRVDPSTGPGSDRTVGQALNIQAWQAM